jgi:hypothetical protein
MIEAVVTCVNYADYLVHTLPHLAKQVDRVVVVTSLSDSETVAVCKSVQKAILVQTDAFFESGAVFAKGRAINQGMNYLSLSDWVLFTDADMLFHSFTTTHPRIRRCLYTMRRKSIIGADALARHLNGEEVAGGEIPMIWHKDSVVPSGYCQLYHFPTCPRYYPATSHAADKDDMAFSKTWPAEHRKLIRGLYAYHLEMPDATKAANWRGRKTARFE